MALLLKHQSVEEFVARVREAWRIGERERLVAIAKFLISRVQTGDLTELQIRNAFGMTQAEWNTLKAKMQSLIDADAVIQGAVGE